MTLLTIPPERESIAVEERKPTLTGVVSLLDMLRFYASSFAAAVAELERLGIKAEERKPKPGVGIIAGAIADQEKQSVISAFKAILGHCKAMNLVHTIDMLDFTIGLYESHNVRWSDVSSDIGHVTLSLYRETDRHVFLKLDSDQAALFSETQNENFGHEVAIAFPSAELDIHEAGNCLALERWPAAVFHCMRVLEVGLNALAVKFGSTQINWHNIIEESEAKIKKLTDKDEQKFYSEAARHFMFLKDGWRNHIMHVRDVFDEGRAISVWQHTKEFMQQISKRLHE